jgi:hypothetical protein
MRVQSFALAMLAALPLLAHSADSPVIASSAVSLNNLTIQLVDLNPNDGIAPGIQFNSLGLLNVQPPLYNPDTGTVSYVGPSYTNSLTPTESLSTTVGNTTSVATPISLSIGTFTTLAQLTAPEAQVYQSGSTTFSTVVNGGQFTLLAGAAGSSTGGATFSLTANTAVIIRGNMSASVTLDGSALSSVLPADQFTWRLSKSYFGNATGVSISLQTSESVLDTETGLSGVGYVSQGSSAGLSPDLYYDTIYSDADPATGLTISRSASKDFVLQYANLGDQDLTADLVVSLNAGADVDLNTYAATPPVDPVVPPVVPGIPEPGTWALMGLGMLGLAAARRHQASRQG